MGIKFIFTKLLRICDIQCPSYDYSGHSSHVTKVEFTKDDSYLISAGGNDAAILQWTVNRS